MPSVSLVICLHRERDLLARLLKKSAGCYDDLVVVHDGPESAEARKDKIDNPSPPPPIDYSIPLGHSALPNEYQIPPGAPKAGSIHELASAHGGRFFEGPRCFQQEPHWPFAWSQAQHDWILRLDADEFPGAELTEWLRNFRSARQPASSLSGYTCIWPVWNGTRMTTRRWPARRNFLFHRHRVRFFGMVEQVPVPDGHYESLSLILHHEPLRKSHGLQNILRRRQGGRWRRVIAKSLLNYPTDLPRWRWTTKEWPEFWGRLRGHPIRAGSYFLVRNVFATLRDQWQSERKLMPSVAIATPLHHLLIGLSLARLQKQRGHMPPTEGPDASVQS